MIMIKTDSAAILTIFSFVLPAAFLLLALRCVTAHARDCTSLRLTKRFRHCYYRTTKSVRCTVHYVLVNSNRFSKDFVSDCDAVTPVTVFFKCNYIFFLNYGFLLDNRDKCKLIWNVDS